MTKYLQRNFLKRRRVLKGKSTIKEQKEGFLHAACVGVRNQAYYGKISAVTKDELRLFMEKVALRPGVNEFDVLSAKECGCLSCGAVYSARDIKDWDRRGDTLSALCPVCGSGAVVCDNEGIDLHEKSFGLLPKRFHKAFPSYREESYRRFCSLYQDGIIDPTPQNEKLYLTYLECLQSVYEDSFAALSLGRHYGRLEKGKKVDVEKAIYYYSAPGLRTNMNALYELGMCYAARGERGDKRLAFEAYSKSAALGSTKASIAIAFCYLFGEYVHADREFGFECLLQIFDEIYPTAIRDSFPLEDFARIAYALASCFYGGYGTKEDKDRALRYYLIAILCCQTHANQSPKESPYAFEKDIVERLEELSPKGDQEEKSIVFDADTFIDSFWDQCDDVSRKEISNVSYDNNTLYFDMDCEVPMIVIDQGNGKVTAVSHMSWAFQNVRYAMHGEDLRFEEICFYAGEEIRFIHHEGGDSGKTVMSITLPPVEEK